MSWMRDKVTSTPSACLKEKLGRWPMGFYRLRSDVKASYDRLSPAAEFQFVPTKLISDLANFKSIRIRSRYSYKPTVQTLQPCLPLATVGSPR